jgi:signal peptidase
LNESAKDEAKEWIKDILVAVVAIVVIMGSLYAYTGIWPPMVVIESGSMQHSSDQSYVGIIDTGDIVLVKESSFSDITTYVEGRATGYERYGDYGDVIIYRPLGHDITPIIHRAVLYLEWNDTHSFDVPGLRGLTYAIDYITDSGTWHGIHDYIKIYDYGYEHKNLVIRVGTLIKYQHSGYISAGDHNVARGYGADQNTGICPEQIEMKWIVGKAVGELPWFGLIKLSFSGSLNENPAPLNSWVMLSISIAIILAVPYIVDLVIDRKKGTENDSENSGLEEPEEIPDREQPQ